MNKNPKYLSIPVILSIMVLMLMPVNKLPAQNSIKNHTVQDAPASKPYTRYWWFASEIKTEDIKFNLQWLKDHGFGGVELAWVYPLSRFNKNDTVYTPRQEWLSPEWNETVDFAIRYADSIGLGCDLTLGTLWPFGDSQVPFGQATQKYGEPNWRQEIKLTWEHPKTGYVIDHLTPKHYLPYLNRMINAFPRPPTRIAQSYFIDSWEVETEKLWYDEFDKDFLARFGYDITPFMDSIYSPENRHYHYDYMSLISEKVLTFYHYFDSVLNNVGIQSRGQVSGAPCDLISGYALLDIPEGESMLFEPEFCAIPASAALLSAKKLVSSESFTCLYGWPRDYIRQEQTADLKLVADALFSNGINHLIWHGKAHNPKGQDTVNFYATTHIGSNGNLEPEISAFNHYLETVSGYMRKGSTYSDIAVYLPTEDAWLAGVMPKEKQFKWAWGYYEMRYVYFPDELSGFNPTWINSEFLEKAIVENGILKVGDASYKALYLNADYLDYRAVKRITELAAAGLTIIFKKDPLQPGAVQHADYSKLIRQIRNSKNVSSAMPASLTPFIIGTTVPRHWCRRDGETIYVFFPNPKADRIKFPLEYGQSLETETRQIQVSLHDKGKSYNLPLTFKPYQSLLYKIEDGKIDNINIDFMPKIPSVKKRPDGYQAPWLIR